MKRTWLVSGLGLTALGLGLLSGCSSDGDESSASKVEDSLEIFSWWTSPGEAEALQALFDELQIIDTSTVDGRRRAYDRMDQDVRAYVTQAENVPAAALTAEELRPRLSRAQRVSGDAVCDVLAACEQARYGPADRLPDANALGETISQLRGALGR